MLNAYSITSFVVKAREQSLFGFWQARTAWPSIDCGLITIENTAHQNGINCQHLKHPNCRRKKGNESVFKDRCIHIVATCAYDRCTVCQPNCIIYAS